MFNKAFLIGNLTRDPELRYTPSGIPVVRFSIAINRPQRSQGEGKGEVDFINIVAWRRLAEICGEFLKKGRPVAIEGRLQIRSYEKDGEKRTISEVVADGMQMLGRPPSAEASAGKAPEPAEVEKEEISGEAKIPEETGQPPEEEIPF